MMRWSLPVHGNGRDFRQEGCLSIWSNAILVPRDRDHIFIFEENGKSIIQRVVLSFRKKGHQVRVFRRL